MEAAMATVIGTLSTELTAKREAGKVRTQKSRAKAKEKEAQKSVDTFRLPREEAEQLRQYTPATIAKIESELGYEFSYALHATQGRFQEDYGISGVVDVLFGLENNFGIYPVGNSEISGAYVSGTFPDCVASAVVEFAHSEKGKQVLASSPTFKALYERFIPAVCKLFKTRKTWWDAGLVEQAEKEFAAIGAA
jgi:hypothetical protein